MPWNTVQQRREQTIDTTAWMHPQGITLSEKTISKGSILYDPIYKTFLNGKIFFFSFFLIEV